MKYPFTIVGVMCLFLLVSCKSSEPSTTSSFYTYETECLGVELDGSQTVRAWGSGKDKSDAIEQAKKNAVYDVLFKGNLSGSADCSVKPLVLEVNAQEKYAAYFDKLLKDHGKYTKYISNKDATKKSRVKEQNQTLVKYGVVVRVLRSELKKRLIKDGIIKQE